MNFDVLNSALLGMAKGPRPLIRALQFSAEQNIDDPEEFAVDALFEHLQNAIPSDDALGVFRRRLAHWDNETAPWCDNTEHNTDERRQLIYSKMELPEAWIELCNARLPFHQLERATIIARSHALWYTPEIRQARQFYWPRYSDQLAKQGFPEESLIQLDESTTKVVERLADPTAEAAYQSKGLVIGYVQSGKTANFTGVMAKAADAGYKLIIVLGGILDVLRSQTQRRVDKELIGKELLGRDYVNDPDYQDFVSHGARPSELGSFDWYRLTGPEQDYQRLMYGVDALKFESANPALPFWHPDNLLRASTRIAVVKKNSAILQRLVTDLKAVSRERLGVPLEQVPALIIDDESDQASINVHKNSDSGLVEERTATNKAIVELLRMLPRAQYVGYTATPSANVLVDPASEGDIFPKDFLITLPRPLGYMGVSDFYDLDVGAGDERPNERDFVRSVEGDDTEPDNLQKAIDSYILSGAIKLFRKDRDPSLKYRHHTMLVHVSQLTAEHKELASLVRKTFAASGYDGGHGLDRLEELFREDFVPVHSRREQELPFPEQFEDLMPFLGECLQAIGEAAEAVLVVNNEHKEQTPDFDRQSVWKILVGGAKLSRGYTVEGLTTSYYRRRAGASDTLMQMGRWFGFRRGYRDLVRLFIGTKEPIGSTGKKHINLYEAFGAICRDEEAFREDLKRYASIEEPRITPAQIPPLVPSHMLKPTAPNKMRNAVVTFRNFGGQLAESTYAPSKKAEIEFNNALVESMLSGKAIEEQEFSAAIRGGQRTMNSWVAECSPAEIVEFISKYKWFDPKSADAKGGNPLHLQLEFLNGNAGDPEISRWLVISPRISKPRAPHPVAGKAFDVVFRSRHTESPSRFHTYNDPVHRAFARHIAGQIELPNASAELDDLRQPGTGVLLYYPITEDAKPTTPKPPYTVGFTLLFPKNRITSPIGFTVRQANKPEEAVVTV